MQDFPLLAAIVLAWGLYGAVHSWLAGTGLKHWVGQNRPALMPAYRLLFNGLALVLLLPPLWLTWIYPGAALWHWPGWIAWPAAIATVAGFLWSLRWYDGMDFAGIRQWRNRKTPGGWHDHLVLSPMHRFVRHPWYSLGLLYLWTRDLNAGWLVAMLAITAYLVIGSRLEERKLIEAFGDSYRRYRARVPALIPLPWHYLRAEEAKELLRLARDRSDAPPAQ
jgi:protein-S-isoprenylcysteine O-methyltransferase Ste14